MYKFNKSQIFMFILAGILFISLLPIMLVVKKATYNDIPCDFFQFINVDFTVLNNPLCIMTRFCSYYLPRLFFLLTYKYSDNLLTALNLYTISHISLLYILVLINLYVAKRTKQVLPCLFGLTYFFIFNIPYLDWFIRESHSTLLVNIILLQYFLTREKLKCIDYFILIFSLVFLLFSFENIAIIGIIYFVVGLLYYFYPHQHDTKDNCKDSKKLYIGIYGLFCSLFNILASIYFLNSTNGFGHGIERWIHHLKMLWPASYSSCLLVTFVGIGIFIFYLLKKRQIKLKDLLFLIPICLLTLLVLYLFTGFIPKPAYVTNYFIYDIILFPLAVLLIILIDYFNVKIKNYVIFNYILVFSFVIIFQLYWQILSNVHYGKYSDILENFIDNSKSPINSYHFSNYFSNYDCYKCTIYRSILLAKDVKNVKTLLFLDKKHRDYKDSNETDEIIILDNTYVSLDGLTLPIKSKYYDLSNCIEKIPEHEPQIKNK